MLIVMSKKNGGLRPFSFFCVSAVRSLVLISVVSAFAASTFARNLVWLDGIAVWKDASGKSPAKARTRNDLAMAYYGAGLAGYAIEGFKKALSLNPDIAMIHSNIGFVYGKEGMLSDAVAHHEKAIELMPSFPGAHENLAIAYCAMKEFSLCINEFKTALSLLDRARTRHNLANAYRKAGMRKEAVLEFESLLRRHDLPVLHNDLGLVYAEGGEEGKARREFSTAIEQDPSYQAPYVNMGFLYLGNGRLNESLEMYSAAVGINPDEPLIHYHLFLLYGKMGDKEEARAHLEKFYKLKAKKGAGGS